MSNNPLLTSEPTTVSAYPNPPMCFISQYTDEAVAADEAPKPPPVPPWPQFSIYGQEYSVSTEEPIVSSLESQGIPRLHPLEFDHKEQLKKMNHSVLLNFLDLIDILVRNPASDQEREQKLDSLNSLLVHMMHLVNEFRPHQARETVRVMLKVQLKQRSEICDRLQQFYDKLQDQFKHYLEVVPEKLKAHIPFEDLKKLDDLQSSKPEPEMVKENEILKRPRTLDYPNGETKQESRLNNNHDVNVALSLDSADS